MEVKEIIDTLTAVNQHLTSAQRALLQLTLRLQHVSEDQLNLAAAQPSQAPQPDAGDRPSDVMAQPVDLVVPGAAQVNIGSDWKVDRFDAGEDKHKAPLAPSMADALETAKTVLKDALRAAGQSQLVDMVDHVSEADLKRVQAATEQPTPADGPTPATTPAQAHEQERERESLKAFIGPESIFVSYLNSGAVTGGRGGLGRNSRSLKRWQEDAFWIEESRLKSWPSGFYQNRDTKATQLLINTERAAVLVDGLPDANAKVYVLRYGAQVGFEPVEMLPALARTAVAKWVEAKFKLLLEEAAA
ncbi:hypothetical protein AWB81_01801 [Caballeronia arationis]|uniref:hypothetical protein n=1 Tax=Caballeronia arationis TaxID=1777142 RepID=UPI00074BD539|nr:hypothetical protein [Caballeronia arationis]SAK59160.1 hypothetical protein AWB81_01801 [Caballeronia arationis]